MRWHYCQINKGSCKTLTAGGLYYISKYSPSIPGSCEKPTVATKSEQLSSMETTEIPPNDPHGRRCLLNLEKWEIQLYARIPREILDSEGYGVVSYSTTTNIYTLLYQWRANYLSDRKQISLIAYSCLFAFIFDSKVHFGRSRNSSLQLKTRKAKTERGRTKGRQRIDHLSRDRFIRPLGLIESNRIQH